MSHRLSKLVFVGALCVFLIPLPLLFVPLLFGASPASTSCAQPSDQATNLSSEQAQNVSTIVGVTHDLGLSERAAVIAVATAKQESDLTNVDHGDNAGPDSRGLFQQRPLFYPGVDPMDPQQAARAFLQRLVRVSGWDSMALTDVAQAVQHSADPQGYAQREQLATDAVAAVWGSTPSGCGNVVTANHIAAGGKYAFPLDISWWQQHPDWFSRSHHDYPAADIPVPSGTTVYSVTAGTVISSPVGGDCGQGVIIQGDDGAQYGYCHGITPLVPKGVHADVGTPIMISGSTGDARGAHLHLQILLPSGQYVCPQSALAAWAQGQFVDVGGLPSTGCVGE